MTVPRLILISMTLVNIGIVIKAEELSQYTIQRITGPIEIDGLLNE